MVTKGVGFGFGVGFVLFFWKKCICWLVSGRGWVVLGRLGLVGLLFFGNLFAAN